MPRMKAAQVTQPGSPIELVEREAPQPGRGQVRIRVQACGICHSAVFTKEGHWPGIQYPRVLGHEVAGRTDRLGRGNNHPSVRGRVQRIYGRGRVAPRRRRGDLLLPHHAAVQPNGNSGVVSTHSGGFPRIVTWFGKPHSTPGGAPRGNEASIT